MSEDDEILLEEEEEEGEGNIFLEYEAFSKKRIKEEPVEEEEEQQIPRGGRTSNLFPDFNVDTNRPSLTVTDSVSFYNLGALIVLLYGHVTEGIKVPSIFDKEKQSMVIKETEFNF